MLSESFEKPSFLSLFAIGFAHALSGFPHFMSTISTIWNPFLSVFSLLGVLSSAIFSEPSIGIRWDFPVWFFVFRAISGLLWLMPLLVPLLLASSNDFLGCGLLGVVALPWTETAAIWGLFLADTGVWGADLTESNSLVIKELMVPVVPTLMDPPPPFIASRVWAMFLFGLEQRSELWKDALHQ